MFENWGFLITEMVVLLVLAAILGLIVGWIVWGRRKAPTAAVGEVEVLRAELATCREAGTGLRGGGSLSAWLSPKGAGSAASAGAGGSPAASGTAPSRTSLRATAASTEDLAERLRIASLMRPLTSSAEGASPS